MRKPNYIYCIVDPRDNSYDYETDGMWTDDLGALKLWQLLGIPEVVVLDPLSMELIARLDNSELEVYIQGKEDEGADTSLW